MPYIPRRPVERKCECCGVTFMSNHARRKFCSDTCRVTSHYKKHGYPVYVSRGRAESLADREQDKSTRIDEVLNELRAIRADMDDQKTLTSTVKDALLNNMGSIVSIVQNTKQKKRSEANHEELMSELTKLMSVLNGTMNHLGRIERKTDVLNHNDSAFINNINQIHGTLQNMLELDRKKQRRNNLYKNM